MYIAGEDQAVGKKDSEIQGRIFMAPGGCKTLGLTEYSLC